MYRDLAKSDADWRWLHRHHLRYDLTVIPPRTLCGEWVKTKGHYHPENPAGVGYPELYEVLEGKAHYLLQSRALDDVVIISAETGDLVIVPPGYGHITINPSPDQTLAMANIVSAVFESEYGDYETRHGGAYYEMVSEGILKNPHYPEVPPVRHLRPGFGKGIHRVCKGPVYDLIGNEDALAFLNFPEQFRSIFTVLLKG
jgi:glucose-6-phosphate isomerase